MWAVRRGPAVAAPPPLGRRGGGVPRAGGVLDVRGPGRGARASRPIVPPRSRLTTRTSGGPRSPRRSTTRLRDLQQANPRRRPSRRGRRRSPRPLKPIPIARPAAEQDRAMRRADHPGAHHRARSRLRAATPTDRLPHRATPAGRTSTPQRTQAIQRHVTEVVAASHIGGVTDGSAAEAAGRGEAAAAIACALTVDQPQRRLPHRHARCAGDLGGRADRTLGRGRRAARQPRGRHDRDLTRLRTLGGREDNAGDTRHRACGKSPRPSARKPGPSWVCPSERHPERLPPSPSRAVLF